MAALLGSGLRGQCDVKQVQRLNWLAGRDKDACALRQPVGATRQFSNRWRNGAGRHAVEIGSTPMWVEPTRVFMPRSAHVPRDLAVFLGQGEFRWCLDLAHDAAQVLARVHALERPVMDPL